MATGLLLVGSLAALAFFINATFQIIHQHDL